MAEDKQPAAGQADSPNPVGRPLKYKTRAALKRAIDAYFAACDPHMVEVTEWVQARNSKGELKKDVHGLNYLVQVTHKVMTEQQPYTMAGLALHLGIDRKTLRSYKTRPDFLPSIEDAKSRCEAFWEGMLATPYSNGAKFNLTNNYADWAEKQVLAGDPDAPLATPYQQVDAATLRKLAGETEEEQTPPDGEAGDAPDPGSDQA